MTVCVLKGIVASKQVLPGWQAVKSCWLKLEDGWLRALSLSLAWMKKVMMLLICLQSNSSSRIEKKNQRGDQADNRWSYGSPFSTLVPHTLMTTSLPTFNHEFVSIFSHSNVFLLFNNLTRWPSSPSRTSTPPFSLSSALQSYILSSSTESWEA